MFTQKFASLPQVHHPWHRSYSQPLPESKIMGYFQPFASVPVAYTMLWLMYSFHFVTVDCKPQFTAAIMRLVGFVNFMLLLPVLFWKGNISESMLIWMFCFVLMSCICNLDLARPFIGTLYVSKIRNRI